MLYLDTAVILETTLEDHPNYGDHWIFFFDPVLGACIEL